ncbi:3-methyl-2-oxobutanoate hydroxymethyltransferase [Aeromonas aquatica]|uniref:3-methyl-2-oxobutanoate hydroxymethyltransferase n=1 Tax=Aeromonas aquatica TaxID=558964 RepID=UPI000AC81174|nr:3-methyl-2-oxobutanoate hydroxymethyltransferase [Aeromonas aquatica]
MVPVEVAEKITAAVAIPTVGIGTRVHCDAQMLVWQDMAGLRTGRLPRFVKQYADMRPLLHQAACNYATDVEAGSFPDPEHSF